MKFKTVLLCVMTSLVTMGHVSAAQDPLKEAREKASQIKQMQNEIKEVYVSLIYEPNRGILANTRLACDMAHGAIAKGYKVQSLHIQIQMLMGDDARAPSIYETYEPELSVTNDRVSELEKFVRDYQCNSLASSSASAGVGPRSSASASAAEDDEDPAPLGAMSGSAGASSADAATAAEQRRIWDATQQRRQQEKEDAEYARRVAAGEE